MVQMRDVAISALNQGTQHLLTSLQSLVPDTTKRPLMHHTATNAARGPHAATIRPSGGASVLQVFQGGLGGPDFIHQ